MHDEMTRTPANTGEVISGDDRDLASPRASRSRGSFRRLWLLLQASQPTRLPRQYVWKLVLLRFVVNAVSLVLVVILVPGVYLSGNHLVVTWLAISALFGALNAFVKPIVQVVMLPLWFASYGLVVIVINAFMLFAVHILASGYFQVSSLLSALLGGLLFGVTSGFLESLLGLTPPIFEGKLDEIRRRGLERRDSAPPSLTADEATLGSHSRGHRLEARFASGRCEAAASVGTKRACPAAGGNHPSSEDDAGEAADG